jgi:hypothetical protein
VSLRFYVGKSLRYDAPGPTNSLLTEAGWTAMLWTRGPTTSPYGVLLRVDAQSYYGHKALGMSGGNGQVWVHQSGADQVTDLIVPSPDGSDISSWVHLAMTATRTGGATTSTIRVFANGSFIKEFTGLEPIDRNYGVSVGGWTGGAYMGNSRIAGVKIFSHAMSGAEVRREMLSLRPVGVEPWMYMPYDDGSILALGHGRGARTGYAPAIQGTGTDPEFCSDNPALPRYYPKRRIFLPYVAGGGSPTPRRLMMMGVG